MTFQTANPATEETLATTPIRTPDQFLDAVDRAFQLLDAALQARRSGAPEAASLALDAEALSQAVKAAPFHRRGGEVVAKGFTPRVVC